MRIVRDRGDARWLPSRFNFALFRLFAYVRLRSAKPEPRPGLMLSVERYQSASENYIVCIVIVLVVASYFAALFHSILLALLGAIIAPQIALILARVIMRIFVSRDRDTFRGGSGMILGAVIAAAVYFAPTLYVARGFLVLVGLNVIAAAIMFLLRQRVAEIEGRFD